VRLALCIRQLLVASWEVDPAAVGRKLPMGLAPALTEAESALVSLAAFRATNVRLDRMRGPAYAQLNVRTYVTRSGEPGVFFLALRVTTPGLPGVLLGAPLRPARIRVHDGAVEAPGLGVGIRYGRAGGPGEAPFRTGPAETRDVAYYEAAGLRRAEAEHDPFAWEAAVPIGPVRVEPLLALGLEVGSPCSLLYADRVSFRLALPLAKVG
jgi:hypothetical protein